MFFFTKFSVAFVYLHQSYNAERFIICRAKARELSFCYFELTVRRREGAVSSRSRRRCPTTPRKASCGSWSHLVRWSGRLLGGCCDPWTQHVLDCWFAVTRSVSWIIFGSARPPRALALHDVGEWEVTAPHFMYDSLDSVVGRSLGFLNIWPNVLTGLKVGLLTTTCVSGFELRPLSDLSHVRRRSILMVVDFCSW